MMERLFAFAAPASAICSLHLNPKKDDGCAKAVLYSGIRSRSIDVTIAAASMWDLFQSVTISLLLSSSE